MTHLVPGELCLPEGFADLPGVGVAGDRGHVYCGGDRGHVYCGVSSPFKENALILDDEWPI